MLDVGLMKKFAFFPILVYDFSGTGGYRDLDMIIIWFSFYNVDEHGTRWV